MSIEEKEHIIISDDLILVKPLNWVTTAVDCDVCGYALRDQSDVACYQKWNCCTDCRDTIIWPNKEKWLAGWRPEKNKEEN